MCARFVCAARVRDAARASILGIAAFVAGGVAGGAPGETRLVFRIEADQKPEIVTAYPDGSRIEALPHQFQWEDELYPSWSPDGRFVALTCGAFKGLCHLNLVDLQKGEVFELTDVAAVDMQPAWSPDGSTVAFASNRGGAFEIWSVRAGSKQFIPLTALAPRVQRHPSWSPGGRHLVFSSDGDLWIVDGDGANLHPWLLGYELRDPVWSPDGGAIAFTFRPAAGFRTEVHVRARDGSAEWSLGYGEDPAWSPDGRRVAFVRYDSATQRNQVFTCDRDRTDLFRVTSDASDKSDPDWAALAEFDPNNYCATAENSVGLGAVIGWEGLPSVARDSFVLTVSDLPPRTHGIFFWSTEAAFLPLLDGVRCVGAPSRRLAPILTVPPDGSIARKLDLARGSSPFLAGTTYHFQYYYRDIRGTRLSDALRVTIVD